MINLQVSCNDLIGNRFNGRDLYKDLQAMGIPSKHLVWGKRTNEKDTIEIAGDLENRWELNHSLKELETAYSAQSLFHPFSYDLMFNEEFLNADIIHYHLIHNNFFNFSHLPILTRLKPTVWTIHDPWAITGHCVYPMECGRWEIGCGDCPDLKNHFAIKNDTTALNWEIKKDAIQQSKLDIIVASQWMYDLVKKSSMFKNSEIHIVPFGLDLKKFKPMDSEVEKKKFGIPKDNVVLTFRATTARYKGLEYIIKALRRIKTDQKITLITFNDKGRMDEFRDKFQVIDLGWVTDDDKMISAYNATDIFLMPSTAEAFGMMAMEAMACAKSCIVMSGTSLPNVVKEKQGGGVVVPQGDVPRFTAEIEKLVNDKGARDSLGARAYELAVENYSLQRYLDDIVSVYKKAIAKTVPDARAEFIVQQQKNILPHFSLKKELGLQIIPKYRWKMIKNYLRRRCRNVKIARYIYFEVYRKIVNGES